MKKLAKDKDFQLTVTKHDLIKKYLKMLEKGNFQSERSSYPDFYDFLKDILGYKRENIDFEEKADFGSGISEFILREDNIRFMVVELKDQNTSLDKPQKRVHDRRTPVQQALDYSRDNEMADWVLVSNFKEFRLYHYKKKMFQYISFDANELLNPDIFRLFMLCFSKKSYIQLKYPDKIRKETINIEKKLEKNFYKLFHETRLMLIKEIEENNECNREKSIYYSQLILNRYMFICFAEDIKNLLPDQISTKTLSNPIKSGFIGRQTLWKRLNELFEFIDLGNESMGISRYNGGLFKEDISSLNIRDIVDDPYFFKDTWQKWKFVDYSKDINKLISPHEEEINPIYKNLLMISSFDFDSELDVNILGHIFEKSIGDIEDLKKGKKGRKKKEGIYYTPPHITDYICRNTIIPYLSKSGNINDIKKLIEEYPGSSIDELDNNVKKIKIVDPACGSGAFLNKAADILLEIHEAIHEKKYLKKDTLDHVFDSIDERRQILLHNIFGVDINEESVEITKLSLFLKVCKKGLELPDLDNNIKCGNSVIENAEYAGSKAFSWSESFSSIDNGKFDIVIGNPPYGTRDVFTKEEKEYFRKIEKINFSSGDSAELFCKKCFDNLVKDNGILGFIIPKKSVYGDAWDDLRINYWKKYELLFLLDTSKSFDDVLLEAISFGMRKSQNNLPVILSYLNNDNDIIQFDLSKKESFFMSNNTVQIYKILFSDLYEKISLNSEYNQVNGELGLAIGKDFFSNEPTDFKLLKGIDIRRWTIKEHRYLKNKDKIDWESANKFLVPKLICQRIISHIEKPYSHIKITACYDDEGILIANTLTSFKLNSNINPKFLLGYLNSEFLNWYAQNYIYSRAIRTMDFYDFYIKQVPIPKSIIENPDIQIEFVKKADIISDLNGKLEKESREFKKWLQYSFEVKKFSKKMEHYYKFSFEDFLRELKKVKIDTKNKNNLILFETEFKNSLEKINPLLEKIIKLEKELNQSIFELYSLNKDEIKVIQSDLK
jgi:type I restriction-modification system DNA methylase subunit